MKKLIFPVFFLLSLASVVSAQEVEANTDNIAGIPIPEGGLPPKQTINTQAHLKAEASTTFGVDLDTGYTGFYNEAKASVELEFVNHDAFSWSNGQVGDGVANPNKGIRGGITVEDFKLSNGDGLALTGNQGLTTLEYININQHNPGAEELWVHINAQGKESYLYNGQIYDVQKKSVSNNQTYLTDPTNQLFTVSYGDIVAYLYVNDFYMKVSMNPTIKAENTVRFWSVPIMGMTESYYGIVSSGYFDGLDNFLGRRYYNNFGGLEIGYQKDNVFNLSGAIASMSYWDRNDTENVGWGMNWINAYAYKVSLELMMVPNLSIAFNTTGAFGQDDWTSLAIGDNPDHNLHPMVADGRYGFLNLAGQNGAFTVGAKLEYTLPFEEIGINNDHQMAFIVGVDSIIDPYASQNSLGTNILSTDKHDSLNALWSNDRGLNSAIAVGAAIRYQWPVSEGEYTVASDDSSDKTFWYDDGEDRYSGVTLGASYTRALGFNRWDKKANEVSFDNFYKDGANSLNVNLSLYEEEEGGLVPGLGFMVGMEFNDILKYGINPFDNDSRMSAFNMAVAGELSYSFKGTWLSPEGRLIPYIGAWYSPNDFSDDITDQNFGNKWGNRLYTKIGFLVKQVIPFTEIGMKWESNNWLNKTGKDKFGAFTTTLKIIYE